MTGNTIQGGGLTLAEVQALIDAAAAAEVSEYTSSPINVSAGVGTSVNVGFLNITDTSVYKSGIDISDQVMIDTSAAPIVTIHSNQLLTNLVVKASGN